MFQCTKKGVVCVCVCVQRTVVGPCRYRSRCTHNSERVKETLGSNSVVLYARWDLLEVFASNYEAIRATAESVMFLDAEQW